MARKTKEETANELAQALLLLSQDVAQGKKASSASGKPITAALRNLSPLAAQYEAEGDGMPVEPALEALLKQQQVAIAVKAGIVIYYGGDATVTSSQPGVATVATP